MLHRLRAFSFFASSVSRIPENAKLVGLQLSCGQSKYLHYGRCLNTIEFHKANIKEAPKQDRSPIAILFGWLLAKSRHLERYGNIYRCHGADVITCKLEVMEVLRPKEAERVATKVLDMLMRPELKDRPIVVHGFSVGGYMYSQVLNKLLTDEKYASVKDNIKGHIFDSPVDFEGIPGGVSAAAFKNNIARVSMKSAITAYLSITEKYTSRVYKERSALFYTPPVKVPSLLLYSLDDPVAESSRIDRLAGIWQTQGIAVRQKPWVNSPHVSHMYTHTDEYIDEVIRFIQELKVFDTILDRETVKANI